MFYDIMIYLQIFFISMVLLMLGYKYMLIMLMFLEIMIMNISLILFLIFSMFNMEFYLIYYLVFSVCESVLGITLLVLIIRFSGSELYFSFNMSKF